MKDYYVNLYLSELQNGDLVPAMLTVLYRPLIMKG